MAWNEGDVTIDGGVRLHYYRRGTGSPVVLAHGATDNGACWARVASALDGDFELIAYDARYHGKSFAPEGGELGGGDDLVAFIEAAGIQRPALLGHSMGAMTVAQAAASQPERFRCAILEDPPWWTNPPEARRAPAMDFSSVTVEQIIAAGREQNPAWHEDEFAAWAESKKQFSPPDDWMKVFGRRVGGWRELVPNLRLPTLLISGGNAERGAIVTAEVAAEVARLAPNLEVVTFPHAGHNVRREALDGYVEAVKRFLARVE